MKTYMQETKFILLSKKSQFEKAIYCMIPTTTQLSGKSKIIQTVKRSVVARC